MSSLVDLLNDHTPLSPPFGGVVVVAGLFGLAWLVSRAAGRVATFVVDHSERKHAPGLEDSGVIASLRQRETRISLARTTVRFVAYVLAALLSLGVLLGADKVQTVAGASFIVILLAFAAQRFLLDMVAGLLMFHERWFQIGDTVVIEPLKLTGIVEDATLRTVTLRNVGGELIRVSNSEVKAVRVIPRGYRRVDVELFVRDEEAGRELVRQVGGLVPVGPTHFIRPPARRRGRPARRRPPPHPRRGRRARRPRMARRGPPPQPRPRAGAGRASRARPGRHVGRRARGTSLRAGDAHTGHLARVALRVTRISIASARCARSML